MTASAIASAIRSRFQTLIAGPQNLLTFYDNQDESTAPPSERWCRVSVLFGETRQASFAATGQRQYRTTGLCSVEIYHPIGGGDGQQLTLADTIVAAFRGVGLSSPPIFFQSPSVTAGFMDGPWWKRNVQITFSSDDYQ